MQVVFVTNNYCKDFRLHKGLSALGKIADKVFFVGPDSNNNNKLISSFTWRIGLPYDEHKINKKLLDLCFEQKPDVVFIIKGNYLYPSTLKEINGMGIKTVSYSLDDLFLKKNRSLFFKYGIRYYDLVVTTKKYNLNSNEFPKWGAKNILFQYQAFDSDIHKPCKKNSKCKYAHDVVFVGSYEKNRHDYLEFLADNRITVHIYSPGWKNKIRNKEFLIIHDYHLYFEDFACALGCSKIALNFLRKINRDLHTSRSLEIPACGGFMLAERTSEHQSLFIEGEEVELFSNKEELLKKIKYYLVNDKRRNEIANAGYTRCYNDGYDYVNRLNEILTTLQTK
jgi:spore maturation protein CgeB